MEVKLLASTSKFAMSKVAMSEGRVGIELMSDCPFHSQLNAYYDGELGGELEAEGTRRLSEHLLTCAACREELAGLQQMSRLFAGSSPPEMLPLELSRLHRHLDEATLNRPAEADFLRTAKMLSALAASVLIISAVWMAEFPSRHAATLSPGVAVVPASDSRGLPAGIPASMPDWERTAVTLRVDPLPFDKKRGSGEEAQINQIGLAEAGSLGDNSVDWQVTDWMVAGLSSGGAHANP